MVFRVLLRAILPGRWRLTHMLAARIARTTDRRVAAGPFCRDRCPTDAVGSVYLAKLLGTYERELHATIEALCAARPACVVVAGAAEGYYVVGLAKRIPGCQLIAYEANPRGRDLLAENLSANGIVSERVAIRGICTVSALRADLQNSSASCPWLIMDVEGAEAVLADPLAIPELTQTNLLIEVHEFALPGVRTLLLERFQDSHDTQQIWAVARTLADFPQALWPRMRRLFLGAALALMDERRPPGMSWLVCTVPVS